jgi:hypothetical protein
LLFSPIGVVSEDDVKIVQTQKESKAAENAVKLTVYQQDEGEEATVAAPVADEPVVRETKKTEAAPAADVSDVIKKWSKKG